MKQPHYEVQFCVWFYDHWVRNAKEWARIRASIENNPVKAGLVTRPADYRWSSATEEKAETTLSSAGLTACATSGETYKKLRRIARRSHK